MALPTFPKVRFYSLYWPLKWPILFSVSFLLGVYYFVQQKVDDPNGSSDVTSMYATIIFSVFIIIFIVSLSIALFTYFLNRFNKRKIQVRWDNNKLEISPLVQPILGYVRLHLLNQDAITSECIQLFPKEGASLFFFTGTMVSSSLEQSDWVREETLSGMVLHVEDPFRFFSFSYYVPMLLERLLLPTAAAENTNWLTLKHPQREEQHTTSQQRKAGDWFHLKSFESGDDVRRIVWKLYAYRKEWMVRQPDQQHPYGDTMQIYISFQTIQGLSRFPLLLLYLETTYKQRLFSLIRGLLQEGMLIDCQLNDSVLLTSINEEKLAMELSKATLHDTVLNSLISFERPPSVIFFSSLDESSHIESLMNAYSTTVFVQVDVLNELQREFWLNRFQSLWFKLSKERVVVKERWWRHPLKHKLIKNNKLLHFLLKQHNGEGGIYV